VAFISRPRENEPSVYICGDTILTPAVILAAGPILMTPDDVIRCISLAPGRAVAIHLEALNHCPTTRQAIRQHAEQAGVLHKPLIPDDGAILQL
jgi:hypothetical protein